MKMTKYIRRPLTTIDNKDFMTWEHIEPQEVKEMVGLKEKVNKRKEEKLKDARMDWKVYINWLWRINL